MLNRLLGFFVRHHILLYLLLWFLVPFNFFYLIFLTLMFPGPPRCAINEVTGRLITEVIQPYLDPCTVAGPRQSHPQVSPGCFWGSQEVSHLGSRTRPITSSCCLSVPHQLPPTPGVQSRHSLHYPALRENIALCPQRCLTCTQRRNARKMPLEQRPFRSRYETPPGSPLKLGQ